MSAARLTTTARGGPPGGHDFWSNAEARSHFAAYDAGRTFAYSTGETTVEGQYVALTRGR